MKFYRQFTAIGAFLILIMVGSLAMAQDVVSENLADSCVAEGEYDPNIDYFPNKVELEYTEGFSVAYFNNYKLVTVTTPWPGADESSAVQYVLVQCGTPVPEGMDDIAVIEVPVGNFAALSTTYLPYVDLYDLTDRLVGVDTLSTVSTPSIVEKGAAGELTELAPNFQLNTEVAVDLNPALIMTYGSGFDTDGYLQLEDAGLTIVLNGDYAESTPLARAEWGKYLALFFNKEAEATALFDEAADDYNTLAELAADSENRPTVFVNAPYEGTWYMAGGESYTAHFLADAGADYLWSDDTGASTLFLDFEAVFERAADADYWLQANMFWLTPEDVLAEDQRYGDFAAFQNGNIWNNNLRLNENFGNDYFESGAAHPNWILADMIAIFHPELLPDHKFYYHQQVGAPE
jgi:iron complex transport system substrate-binding protein